MWFNKFSKLRKGENFRPQGGKWKWNRSDVQTLNSFDPRTAWNKNGILHFEENLETLKTGADLNLLVHTSINVWLGCICRHKILFFSSASYIISFTELSCLLQKKTVLSVNPSICLIIGLKINKIFFLILWVSVFFYTYLAILCFIYFSMFSCIWIIRFNKESYFA